MAGSARQLILELLARDKTDAATRSASGNFDNVAEAAEGAARSSERLGKESDKAEDQVERFGRSARTAAQHVDDLDDEIRNVERELARMAIAWKVAESAAEKADLSKAIRRTQRDLRDLNKNKGLIGSLLPDAGKLAAMGAQAGVETGTSFLGTFSKAVTSAGPLGAIGVGIGLGVAPGLGATVAAGLIGGASAGGILGGLAVAKRDARVKAAAKSLGEEILQDLDESAGAFVPAALHGIDQLRGSFRDMDGDLRSIFDNSARYVGPLVSGVTGLIEKTVNGAEKVVAKAGPLFDALERNLPRIGDALGDVLEDLADNAPEAAVALGQLFDVMETGIRSAGVLINGLTEVYGFMASAGLLGEKARREWIAYTATAAAAEASSGELAASQERLGIETKTAAEAAEEQRKAILELNKTMRAQVDPLFAFMNAQDQVRVAQNKLNEAIKEHGPKSREAAAATRALTDAALDLRDKASAVGTTADGKLTPALQRALVQAGLTEREIRGVETQLGRARAALDRYDGTNARATVTVMTAEAEARVKRVRELLAQVRSKKISVNVLVNDARLDKVNRQLNGGAFRAAGGPVTKGMPYVVGEKRPEVFVPESNGRIVPSVAAYARTGGGAAAGAAVVTLDFRNADSEFARFLIKLFRTSPAVATAVNQHLAGV